MIDQIATIKALTKAWNRLNKNDGSHGLSGVTILDFKNNLESNIAQLSKDLKERSFVFSETRASFISKKNGSPRPLQIPEVRDRVVLKSIALFLEQLFNDELQPNRSVSFAYQKNTGVKAAITKLIELTPEKNEIILETDIEDFFSNISLKYLLANFIYPKLKCDYTKDLIQKGLVQKPSVKASLPKEVKQIFHELVSKGGIPQGNPLSPLLSNIYLSKFDQYAISRDYKMIRYADDILIICLSTEEAEEIQDDLSKYLSEELNLSLKEEKTTIIDLSKESVEFLSIVYNGNQIMPSLSAVKKLHSNLDELVDQCKTKQISIVEFIQKVKFSFEGWLSVFSYTLVDDYIDYIDHIVDRILFIGFHSLEWKLARNTLGKLPTEIKVKGKTNLKLSRIQRQNSGISLGSDILNEKRKKHPLLINEL